MQTDQSSRCRNTYHTLCSSSECKCNCHSWLHPLLDAVRKLPKGRIALQKNANLGTCDGSTHSSHDAPIKTDAPARIGYLSSQHVLCMNCAPAAPKDMVPLYNGDWPTHSQSCHQCGTVMHWPRVS